MNVLFSVSTPYQMIGAVQLSMTEFDQDTIDLVVTDSIAQYQVIAEKAKQSGIFRYVNVLETKKYKWQSWKYTLLGYFYDRILERKLPNLNKNKYDLYLFANSGGASECLATLLNRKYKTKLAMYEDGFVAYSDFYKNELSNAFKPETVKSRMIYLMRKRAPYYIGRYYVFDPILLEGWRFPFNIKEIRKLDESAIRILNIVFDYDNCKDKYKCNYIFFEESYFADGLDIGDVEIVENIAEVIGKEDLIIKIHPRNPINRFKEKGFNTNVDTSVPWEVIALNIDISSKTLMTVASGSSITSYFISNRSAKKSLLLYEMEGINKNMLTPSIDVFDKICKHVDYFVYPSDENDLRRILIEK